MIRRAVVVLAALAAGTVVLTPVGEVLFYGLEGFPVGADAKGVIRILSAAGAILLLALGAAAGAQVTGRARGWPTAAAAMLAGGLLLAYAPLDPDSAFGEAQPWIRPVVALLGGVALGAVIVAVLPARPGAGDPWPGAAFAAGAITGLPIGQTLLPQFPDLHHSLGWADLVALVLAVAAAFVAPRPETDPATPGLRAVTPIALLGTAVAAAFHMEYVGRATEASPTAVVVIVLALTLVLWATMTWLLVGWSGKLAGTDAARFALTCAGAAGPLFLASGRNMGLTWPGAWAPLLGIVAAVAGAWLTRQRTAVPWDAYGVAAAALIALVIGTATTDQSAILMLGVPVAAFTLGAALARTAAGGALCGLLVLVLTLPVLIGTIKQLDTLLMDETDAGPGFASRAALFSPIWLVGLLTAALLIRPRRTAAAPLAVG
ncbi:hypothetical protein [Asanoa iriomotensis]|uniref:MFS transporter n=1 Tax=Asanoa iriomotensis TaxID=234613 RepID=A0ABQ4C8R4_9ACTN|nr:hypothetical protein [Asanoa iriomotensis]GIF59148.1 hypothetical protein Air01nite_52430 [Asanoa iriomotensis]